MPIHANFIIYLLPHHTSSGIYKTLKKNTVYPRVAPKRPKTQKSTVQLTSRPSHWGWQTTFLLGWRINRRLTGSKCSNRWEGGDKSMEKQLKSDRKPCLCWSTPFFWWEPLLFLAIHHSLASSETLRASLCNKSPLDADDVRTGPALVGFETRVEKPQVRVGPSSTPNLRDFLNMFFIFSIPGRWQGLPKHGGSTRKIKKHGGSTRKWFEVLKHKAMFSHEPASI